MAREMKDSGIAWIGEIPSHWRISKIKNETFILDYLRQPISAENRNNTLGLYDYYGASGVIDKIDDYNVDDKVLLIGEDGANLVLRNLPLIYKAEGRFWVNNHAHILKVKDDNYYEYMYYMLEAGDYYLYITGSAQPKLSQDNMKNFLIPIPPLSEQQAIADYLDWKCGEIDELISLQEKIIEELKAYKQSVITEAVTKGLNPDVPMKDSGIEWIGEVPQHWRIIRIKFLGDIVGRIGFKGYTTNDLVPAGEGAYTIGGKHISKCFLDLSNPDFISWEKFYESPEIMVKKGDILIAQRGSLGKSALVKDEIGEATINPSLVILKNIKVNAKFIHYILISDSFLRYIDIINTATAVPMISQYQIENFNIALPNLKEQQVIADYLDNKCSEIDSLIALKQKKIEALKDYKKSIIYECVTGKKEV